MKLTDVCHTQVSTLCLTYAGQIIMVGLLNIKVGSFIQVANVWVDEESSHGLKPREAFEAGRGEGEHLHYQIAEFNSIQIQAQIRCLVCTKLGLQQDSNDLQL